jgi:hypothetical protein
LENRTKPFRRIKVQRTLVTLFAASLALVVLFPNPSFAQARKRSTSKSATTATPPPKTAEVTRAGATRVASQIKSMTRFIYVLGGVAKGLESVDDAAKRNEASPAIVEQNQKYKQQVRTSIQTMREALDKLEIDFRATPELQRYYIGLAGVAQGAATAEELAATNKFDQAGRSLLSVVDRLTDVLLAMR